MREYPDMHCRAMGRSRIGLFATISGKKIVHPIFLHDLYPYTYAHTGLWRRFSNLRLETPSPGGE